MTRVKLFTSVTIALLAGSAWHMPPAQASAEANPNPIDWTITRTIFGKNGEDLPLRVGQHDLGDVDGFGLRHISDGHGGFVPDSGLIQDAADTCESNPKGTTSCQIADSAGRRFIVVWTERIDSRAPDGRPVGIITAYYP
jgi:hypothetical protein